MDQNSLEERLRSEVVPRFQHTSGTIQSLRPHGSGLINDTYKVVIRTTEHDGVSVHHYILQRLNHEVFTRPVQVMSNIERVTSHLARKIRRRQRGEGVRDATRRETLNLVPTVPGESERCFALDDQGNYWRMYDFISGATAYQIGDSVTVLQSARRKDGANPFREAGASFAQFQKDLQDLPEPRLYETIPGFGDSGFRFRQFREALAEDCQGLANYCEREIQFCLHREREAYILPNLLKEGRIPERITHFDTKIDNLLIDDTTGTGLCVIDLDTVMPGLAIYDFGDCVRTAAALGAEDEADLTKVGFSIEIFAWVAEGYLSVGKGFLSSLEMDHLVLVSRMVTFTMGMRFLTDHLNGDVYYKTSRENHNLHRARTQLKMVAEMEAKLEEMNAIIQRLRN